MKKPSSPSAPEKVEKKQSSLWLDLFKFLPLVIFGVLVIACKLDLLLAAPIATFCALCVYMLINRCGFEAAFDKCLSSVKHIVLIFFILMFAYGVAECFMVQAGR